MDTYKISNRRYLGSKTRLLPFIDDVITENCKKCSSLFDVFGGTGVVGDYFNKRYEVIENDFLYSNYLCFEAFLGTEKVNEKKILRLIDILNDLKPRGENYYSKNFADTYLSKANMKKVGAIRDEINRLFSDGKINVRERAVLITALLYAIDHIANTVGHYDAYRKGASLDKELLIKPLEIDSKHNYGNEIYNTDSNVLAESVNADIAYIDPPYNSRQYADAYHFLENVARNEKPIVEGVARKMDRSAIKSRYNTKSAPKAFAELVQALNAKYILVSYNNIGEKANARSNAKISDIEIISTLEKRGKVKIFEKEFNSFTTGKTKLEDHKERLFLCEVGVFEESDKLNSEVKKIQSPLNYTGGKFRLLPQLEERFPSDIRVFYDIFCGGCNVGSNVEAGRIVCVDNCKEIVSLFSFLKEHTFAEVDEKLRKMIADFGLSDTSAYGYEYYGCNSSNGVGKYNSKNYIRLRDSYNKDSNKDPIKFLLLVIFAFNNQIRFNKKGEFNLPVGKRDYNKALSRKLQGFMSNIQRKNISFVARSFEEIDLRSIRAKESFFYLDPPYSLGLAAYNENGGWSNEDDKRLFVFLEKCNKKGIRFALSNVMEHKGVRNEALLDWCLKNQFNINYLDYSYNNSNYHSLHKQGESKEVLITNY